MLVTRPTITPVVYNGVSTWQLLPTAAQYNFIDLLELQVWATPDGEASRRERGMAGERAKGGARGVFVS